MPLRNRRKLKPNHARFAPIRKRVAQLRSDRIADYVCPPCTFLDDVKDAVRDTLRDENLQVEGGAYCGRDFLFRGIRFNVVDRTSKMAICSTAIPLYSAYDPATSTRRFAAAVVRDYKAMLARKRLLQQ